MICGSTDKWVKYLGFKKVGCSTTRKHLVGFLWCCVRKCWKFNRVRRRCDRIIAAVILSWHGPIGSAFRPFAHAERTALLHTIVYVYGYLQRILLYTLYNQTSTYGFECSLASTAKMLPGEIISLFQFEIRIFCCF